MDFINMLMIYIYVAAYVITASCVIPLGIITSPYWIKQLVKKCRETNGNDLYEF